MTTPMTEFKLFQENQDAYKRLSQRIARVMRRMIRVGDKVTVARCGGGRASYIVANMDDRWIGSATRPRDDCPSNVIRINGETVNPLEQCLLAEALTDTDLAQDHLQKAVTFLFDLGDSTGDPEISDFLRKIGAKE